MTIRKILLKIYNHQPKGKQDLYEKELNYSTFDKVSLIYKRFKQSLKRRGQRNKRFPIKRK